MTDKEETKGNIVENKKESELKELNNNLSNIVGALIFIALILVFMLLVQVVSAINQDENLVDIKREINSVDMRM